MKMQNKGDRGIDGIVQTNGKKNLPWVGHWAGNAGPKNANWQVYCGDSLSVLRSLESQHFSCVITSPPYYCQRNYGVIGQIGLEDSFEEYVNSVCSVMDEVKRVLDPRGLLFLNLGDTYYSGKGQPHGSDPKHNGRRLGVLRPVDASGLGVPRKTLLGIPWRVALEMINRKWILRAPIVWQKKQPIPEANVCDRPWRTYEYVFLFAKSPKYRFSRRPLAANSVEDVWTIESRPKTGRDHPAAFPCELVARCLELASLRSGCILDPFVGSGTVMRVALDRGMNAVGIDLNSRFCRAIAKELQ